MVISVSNTVFIREAQYITHHVKPNQTKNKKVHNIKHLEYQPLAITLVNSTGKKFYISASVFSVNQSR